ncbi:tetratricopeptide repeat protein [Pacificibacter maritimus]|uniref:Tetratricopeptide repeat protein n=1 Tax=Pacificibacter maritimus TaxID=762213 RepID=A0A3N4UMF1_9RHOB|nr:sulfotransferase [Pacificibacter maritimus]RPE71188.1 tetratricopeptide repeat protein [Pacificibacter maritimus]
MNAPLFPLAQPFDTAQMPDVSLTTIKSNLRDLVDQAQWDRLQSRCNDLLADHPQNAFILSCLGVAQFGQGHFQSARLSFEMTLAQDPQNHLAAMNLAKTCLKLKDAPAAVFAAQQATRIAAQTAETLAASQRLLGLAQSAAQNIPAAIEAYLRANDHAPCPTTWTHLGDAYRSLGQLEKAEQSYVQALTLTPDFTPAHLGLSTVHHYTADDPHLETMVYLLQHASTATAKRDLSFALARVFETLGAFETAFILLHQANALRKSELGYDPSHDRQRFDALHKSADLLQDIPLRPPEQRAEVTPIFVVGMPRSGTSLTQRILAGHSEISGAGELPYAARYGSDLVFGRRDVTPEAVQEFRDNYLTSIAAHAQGAAYVVDKMPQNFNLLALIIKAIPEAIIIHTTRDAKATCWSNYKQFFSSTGLQYCYDLNDITAYYKDYTNLMQRWMREFPDRIIALDYDALTIDPDRQIPMLISALGLEMQSACLRPHDDQGAMTTASAVQVRQKIYAQSSDKWRAYAPYITGNFHDLPEGYVIP